MRDREERRKECLRKCGNLLAQRDYTCARLRDKLTGAGYEEDLVAEVLESLIEAHYLDDRRYAQSFVEAQWENRSKRRIRADLESRGVPSQIISEVLEEASSERGNAAEIRQIRRLIEKRCFDPSTATWEERSKIQAFLYRKGYGSASVRIAMNVELLDSDEFSV
jgi:regulatory protein